MSILEVRGLSRFYGSEINQVKALDDVSFSVTQGEFISVVGKSGSGKTTMLHLIGGLDRPTSGEVIIKQKSIFSMAEDDLTVFRRQNIGVIFQSYNLIPTLSAFDNIILPVGLDKKRVDADFFEKVISTLQIKDRLHELPVHLSGGEQQRVTIARALIAKPALILADEPTGNLDTSNSESILSLLEMTSKTFNQTIVMITHDEDMAKRANRVIQMHDGKIASIKEGKYA